MGMKAHVDKDTCIGCGLCEGICPKVFKMDEDGKAKAIETELDASLEAEARDAESQCPVEAISVK
jgi:ferredoxin